MIALIRKNLRLWGYGKSLALFAGCILFSISGRLNGGIAYERHILSAVSDHYYLTYFVLPIVLLSCFSFIDDDGEPIILRFQSYHSYFLKKWIGVGLIAVILTAVQTGAILLSGIGLPLGNEWNLAAGTTEAELFSALEQLFVSPLQAFVCFTLFQLIGSWLIFGICMWIGHFTERKWTIRIVIVLYVLSAVWIKLPAIQNIPLTSFNHLLILHHNFGEPARPWITGFTLLLFMLTIMFSVRFAWRGHLPQLRLKCHGIAAYYSYELMTKRNILILLAVVVGITLYKGLGYGAAEFDAEWIYSLFAGHGTGYFQVFPFLEMLITSGVPLYLLAAFVEHTVNGQSIFISVRAKSRRHLVKGILSVSTKFLIIYAFFWLMAGLIGASLFSTGLTIVSFRLMLYAVLMKCLDILAQYLIVLDIYIATRQVTIGFLVLVAGNLLCILPGNWVAYSPFGLSSLTRISVVEPGIGISADDCRNPYVGLQENIELGGQNMSSYIEVKNVSKSFSGRAILQNISLPVEQGTTVGLVGANGSGKSVLFKIICGFEKPDQGSVYVRGNQLGKNGCDFPESLGVFINSPGFIGIYNGFQNLKFLADIQGKIGEKEIRQAMSKVGLDPDNKTKVDNYSLGMKQKLGLAQAIMEGQDILILDEPFNALDYKTYEDVKAIIRMLKAEGKTIFLTSHHYKDIEQLCDQVYSLEDCQLLPITEEIAARYREMD